MNREKAEGKAECKVCLWRSSEERAQGGCLGTGADEGRGKLRKATGSRKQAKIRGFPNGATRRVEDLASHAEYIGMRGETGGTETS